MADKDEKKKKRAVVEEVVETPNEGSTTEMPHDETLIQHEAQEVTHPEEHTEVEHHTHVEHHELHDEEHLHESGPMQVPPQPMEEDKVNIKFIIFLTAFIAIILGGLAGGLIVYLTNTSPKTNGPAPSPLFASSEPVASPSPAAVDKTKFTADIQNGSGIAGQGAAVQKILTDAGFKVGNVGNAKTFDFKKTVVQAKDSVDADYLKALTDTLSKSYSLDVTQKLATSSASDVNIIVGSTKTGQ